MKTCRWIILPSALSVVGIVFAIFKFENPETWSVMLGALAVVWTLCYQANETARNAVIDRFFKMLDYHNNNVNILSVAHVDLEKEDVRSENRRAFVVLKIQLHKLICIVREVNNDLDLKLYDDEIIDIAYVSFYYGIDKEWGHFLKDKLSKYNSGNLMVDKLLQKKEELDEKFKIGRTNQTSLSAYFRNMYNAIKLIDSSNLLTENEKKQYVTILRAQLSNPELYILFFNLLSRFGKKWKKKEYIKKYEFIKNLPLRYCSGFEPSQYFDIKFEEDEL